jgi:excisionase family DNA binding protein
MNKTDNVNQTAPVSAVQIEPELLTKAETAQLLSVSTRTIDNMMRQRRISFVKLTAKMVRFPRKEILKHVHENLTIHAYGSEIGITGRESATLRVVKATTSGGVN